MWSARQTRAQNIKCETKPHASLKGIRLADGGIVFRLVFLLLVATAALASAQIDGGQRRDLPYGGGINLRDFAGPNVEIMIYAKNMGVLDFPGSD